MDRTLTYLIVVLLAGLWGTKISAQPNAQPHPSPKNILQASLAAVGKNTDRNKVKNLITFAQCTSPAGNYTTELHVTTNEYSFFKQVYTYKPAPFEAITKGVSKGFLIGKTNEAMPPNMVYVIRSHHFHNAILEIKRRFHDFEPAQVVQAGGKTYYQIKAKDELNHECSLLFDQETKLLVEFHIQNPENAQEIIKTRFRDWRTVQGLLLPHHLEIDQNGKIFTFDFVKIAINSPDFREIMINDGK